MPRIEFNRRTNAQLVSRALHQLDIPSQVNDRHDITIDNKKVSGSAFKIVSNRSYHHGTMLIDADLSRLSKYLSVKEVKRIRID
jgi:lipoate-protein ligase A